MGILHVLRLLLHRQPDVLHDVRLFQLEDVRFDVGIGCVTGSWNHSTIEQENLLLRSLLHSNSILGDRNSDRNVCDRASIIDVGRPELTSSTFRVNGKLFDLHPNHGIADDILCCSYPR